MREIERIVFALTFARTRKELLSGDRPQLLALAGGSPKDRQEHSERVRALGMAAVENAAQAVRDLRDAITSYEGLDKNIVESLSAQEK